MTTFQQLWSIQGKLFTQQRVLITSMQKFIPKEFYPAYNIAMTEINDTVKECQRLDALVREEYAIQQEEVSTGTNNTTGGPNISQPSSLEKGG